MGLSNELLSQFVKTIKDDTKVSNEATVYGTIVYDGRTYVKIDGSDLLTPVSTTTNVEDGERVTVMIKDHTATVTGNLSSPSARTDEVEEVSDKITQVEILVADKVSAKELEAESARIDDLVAGNVTIKGELDAAKGEIGDLKADNVTINKTLAANKADIERIDTEKLDAKHAAITYATIENLDATNADIHDLESTYATFESTTTKKLEAVDASIEDLETNKLSAESADLKYANIDFSNIGEAAIENFYAKSGVIEDLTIEGGTVTGTLVGVTIKGDLIEGGTIVADKLVVKGDDGLYYKLNVDGESVETEQTEYNSLNGSVITAKSITATKISVSDLVAFDATIGGFKITDTAIYSGAKASADNTTEGVYMDSTGQLSVGDQTNFLRYFRDTDGNYKLEISGNSVILSSTGRTVEEVVTEVNDKIDNLDIGGRNLVLNSSFSEDLDEWDSFYTTDYTPTASIVEYDGVKCAFIAGSSDNFEYLRQDISPQKFDFTNLDQEYTFSVDACVTDYVSTGDGLTYPAIYLNCRDENSNKKTYARLSVGDYSDQGWHRTFATFKFDKEYTSIRLIIYATEFTGNFYFKNIQLEKGNVPTDWTPAPEDTDKSITEVEERVHQVISDKETSILSTSEEIVLSALDSYVAKSEYDEFKETVNSEFTVRADEMTMKFEGVEQSIADVNGELQSTVSDWSKHISFSDDGIILTSGSNALQLQLDNEDGIIFSRNGIPFGLWDGTDFFTGNIVVKVRERAQLGRFAYVPRSDGSLSFLKVSGDVLFTVHPIPVSAASGTTVTFSAEATGSKLTYQWQRKLMWNNAIYKNWTDIDGATSNSYSFSAKKMTFSATGMGTQTLTQYYRCVATDIIGASAASNEVTLTIT